MRTGGLFCAALLLLAARAAAQQKDVASLLTYQGMPTSPALALLPGKVSEVVHLGTPADLRGAATTWLNGSLLRTGAALDLRPAMLVRSGSIQQYWRDPARQVLWRTVLSAGTAVPQGRAADRLLALGLRVPIVDRSDPRADSAYVSSLEQAVFDAMTAQPPADMTLEQWQALVQSTVSKKLDVLRQAHNRSSWNRAKLDVGLAGSLVARHARLNVDSVTGDRAGGWLSGAIPVLGTAAQLAGTAKLSWAHTDSAAQESARHVGGVQLRVFAGSIAASAEASHVWSRHAGRSDLNEGWYHFAGVVEVPTSILGRWLGEGWLELGYGGDSAHRTGPKSTFSLGYAVNQQRQLKP